MRKSQKSASRNSRLLVRDRAKSLNQLLEEIERERGNLMRADSLLCCLSIAMDHEPQSTNSPYYPDVVEIAREVVRGTIDTLDSVNLPARKVRDEFRVGFGLRGQLQLPQPARTAECLPPAAPSGQVVPRRLRLRLHRRVYSSDLARRGRSDCADMLIG